MGQTRTLPGERNTIIRNCSLPVLCRFVNTLNRDKQTALHIAAERSFCDGVKILLGYKADPTVKDHEGWTALHAACGSPIEQVLSGLLGFTLMSPCPGNGTTDDDRGGEPTQPRRRSLAQSIACSSDQTVLCRVTGRGRADPAPLRRQGGPHGVSPDPAGARCSADGEGPEGVDSPALGSPLQPAQVLSAVNTLTNCCVKVHQDDNRAGDAGGLQGQEAADGAPPRDIRQPRRRRGFAAITPSLHCHSPVTQQAN